MKQQWYGLATTGSSIDSLQGDRFVVNGVAPRIQGNVFTNDGIISSAGTIRNFYVKLNQDPITDAIFTIYLNGNAGGNATTLSVTVPAGSTTGSDTTHSVSVSAGDFLAVKHTGVSPEVSTIPSFSLEFEGTTSSENCYPTSRGTTNAFTTRQFDGLFHQSGTWQTTEGNASDVCPLAGTITALYVKLNTAPSTRTVTVSIYKNGAEEATSQVAITGAATTGNVTGLSIAVVAGDTLSMSVIRTGAGTYTPFVAWGTTIQSTTEGESVVVGRSLTNLDTAGTTQYVPLNNHVVVDWNSTEPTLSCISGQHPTILRNLYVKLSTAPGAGKSYTFTSRKNGGAGNQTVAISDTNTINSDPRNVDPTVANDYWNLAYVSAGTPTAATASWSMVQFIGRRVHQIYHLVGKTLVSTDFSPTVDGNCQCTSVAGSFASKRGGNGVLTDDSSSNIATQILSLSTSGNWGIMTRSILGFDTSIIGSSFTIVSATLVVYVQVLQDDFAQSLGVVQGSLITNTALSNADFQGNVSYTTRWSTDVTLASIKAQGSSSYAVSFPFNASGLAGINKTGVTVVGLKLSCDIDNSEPTWASLKKSNADISSSETGSFPHPTLTITYTN